MRLVDRYRAGWGACLNIRVLQPNGQAAKNVPRLHCRRQSALAARGPTITRNDLFVRSEGLKPERQDPAEPGGMRGVVGQIVAGFRMQEHDQIIAIEHQP